MPRGRSWRSIRQEVAAPALSRRGRKRRHLSWLKAVGVVGLVGAGVWGVVEVAQTWADRTALARAVNSARLAPPVLITDGVLTQAWLENALELPRTASLMALELPALRDRLLAHGQVRVAVLTRSFPDTLVVTIQERMPVARVQVEDRNGRKQLLVARDGTVYEGVNYAREMVGTLPWLDGFALRRQGEGYAPIAGMEEVARLLATAQTEAPWLYRDWHVVSLARLEGHGEITVRMSEGPTVVFGRQHDFYKQIARLEFILDQSRDRLATQPVHVNLALGGQAAVRFERSAREIAANERTAAPAFRLQPQETPPSRDLFQ